MAPQDPGDPHQLRLQVQTLLDAQRRLTMENEALKRRLNSLDPSDEAEPVVAPEHRSEDEERFRDFAESSADWFWETDAEQRFSYLSPNFERLIGVPIEDSLGKTREELSVVDLEGEHWERLRQAIRERKPFRDFTYCRLGGGNAKRWVCISGKPIFDSTGRFLGYRGSGSDVTERRISEESLRESEQLLRNIVDNSPSAIFLKHLDGRYQLVNESYGAWFGVDPRKIVGKTAQDVFPPGLAKNFEEQDRKVLETGGVYEREVEVPLADGGNHIIQFIKFPVYDSEGGISGIGVIGTDVTELTDRESALRKNEALLAAIVEHLPVGLSMKSMEDRFQFANSAYREFSVDPEMDIVGHPTSIIARNEAHHETITRHENRVLERRAAVIEERELTTSADTKIVTITKFPVFDADDNIVSIGSILVDNTERQRIEEQLRQAQKMEVVGQLTGGVAHDFNNLLGVIIGNLEYLDEKLDDGSDRALHRKLLTPALAAALRGAELTNRLLAFSRKQALQPEITDLNKQVTALMKLLRRTLGENIDIQAISTDGLWLIEIDAAQLESALLNLVVNAGHAMPAGGKLTIETGNVVLDEDFTDRHEDVHPGEYAMLAISDTGGGMSPDVLNQVFEPFFTTKDVGQGSGLGLSMVHGFVKQTGGHISIDSEVGAGTTVKLYFPRSDTEQNAHRTDHPEVSPAGSGEAVLIVEDDADLRELAVTTVTSLGYRVHEASDGSAALQVLRDVGEIDLLFTDVVLPKGMNGAELAALAREIRPGLKVLYTSGYTENAIVHNGVLDEGVDLIAKPYRRAPLAEYLQRLLKE